jgi:hypothetical protein
MKKMFLGVAKKLVIVSTIVNDQEEQWTLSHVLRLQFGLAHIIFFKLDVCRVKHGLLLFPLLFHKVAQK